MGAFEFVSDLIFDILTGDARKELQQLPDACVQTCVTSPPYFGLRDYGVQDQIGAEPDLETYVTRLAAVFEEVRRVLRNDGTLWLNLGDSYSGSGKGAKADGTPTGGKKQITNSGTQTGKFIKPKTDCKPKDLIGVPWQVAFALRAAGWYLRQDIIWHKPNPMPESVRDRCTRAHEYIFMFTKSPRYYYDADAIRTPAKDMQPQNKKTKPSRPKSEKQRGHSRRHDGLNDRWDGMSRDEQMAMGANKRSVWSVPPAQFKEAHFATFPPALIEPCVLAGSRAGDIVLDPFSGAGTTGLVARQHGRGYVGIELNPEYVRLSWDRINSFSENV